jgi:predicted TIM-barrel fold metal-dependent hydrolase
VSRAKILDGHIHWGEWRPEREGWPGATLPQIRDALRRSGIDGAALMPTDRRDNEGLAAAIAADPEDLFLFAWVTPQDVDGTMDFLERHGDRVAGLKIHPSLERMKVSDDGWSPFLRWADEHRRPVIVHSGRWQEMASWRFCLDVAERYLQASIVIAHLGGDLPTLQQDCSEEMRVRALPNAYLGTESIREYYSLRIALDRLGAERIVFGSDYPLGWPSAYLGVLDGACPSEEERRLVLGGNLLRLIDRGQARATGTE